MLATASVTIWASTAWGYWSVGWLGNVSYLALFFKTLNDLLGEHALYRSPLS